MDDHEKTSPAAPGELSPLAQTVAAAATATRTDLPQTEVEQRAQAAVDDLQQGRVQAFTVPLAVKRVRGELNAAYGHPASRATAAEPDAVA